MDAETVIRTLMSHRSLLMAYARSIVGDLHLAEDVFQEVSSLAVSKAGEIESESHLLGWARHSTRFMALRQVRSRQSRPATLEHTLLDSLDAHWEQVDRHQDDLYAALELCMQELSPHARQLLKLRYVDGVRGESLAAQFGRKLSTTYATLAKVHGSLNECIERRLKANGDFTKDGFATDGGLSHA